jgi:hypothetical protein
VIDGCEFTRPGADNTTTPKLISSSGVSGEIFIRNNVVDLKVAGSDPVANGCGAGTWGTAAWRIFDTGFKNQQYGGDTCPGGNYDSRTVFAEGAQPIEVDGNDFFDTLFAIYTTGSQPNGSKITNNNFRASSDEIRVRGLITSSSNQLIKGNSFGGAGYNLWIESANNNTVENNFFDGRGTTSNDWQVVLLPVGAGTHSGNVFRKNRFYASSRALLNFTANTTVDARDNYWDTYSGSENDVTLGLGRANSFVPAGWPGVDINPWIGPSAPTQDPLKSRAPGFWPVDYPTIEPLSALPSASGDPFVGVTLTGTDGTWSNDPTITYQWQASTNNGVTWSNISGATDTTYTITRI